MKCQCFKTKGFWSSKGSWSLGFCADVCVGRVGKKYHLGRGSSIMVLATVFLPWREWVAKYLETWISWVDVSLVWTGESLEGDGRENANKNTTGSGLNGAKRIWERGRLCAELLQVTAGGRKLKVVDAGPRIWWEFVKASNPYRIWCHSVVPHSSGAWVWHYEAIPGFCILHHLPKQHDSFQPCACLHPALKWLTWHHQHCI